MRTLLVLGALALTLGSQPAIAYSEGPWCAKVQSDNDRVTERCDLPSFDACLRVIQQMGPSFCTQNPAYNPRLVEKPRRKHYR